METTKKSLEKTGYNVTIANSGIICKYISNSLYVYSVLRTYRGCISKYISWVYFHK